MKRLNGEYFVLFFFKKYAESLSTALTKNKILTTSELHIFELIREIFLQLRGNSPFNILTHASNPCTYETSRKQHGLFPSLYCRTVTKKKSIENAIRVCYNWLKTFDLIPLDITILSSDQMNSYMKNICLNYVAGCTEIFILASNPPFRNFFEIIRNTALVLSCIVIKSSPH